MSEPVEREQGHTYYQQRHIHFVGYHRKHILVLRITTEDEKTTHLAGVPVGICRWRQHHFDRATGTNLYGVGSSTSVALSTCHVQNQRAASDVDVWVLCVHYCSIVECHHQRIRIPESDSANFAKQMFYALLTVWRGLEVYIMVRLVDLIGKHLCVSTHGRVARRACCRNRSV